MEKKKRGIEHDERNNHTLKNRSNLPLLSPSLLGAFPK